MDVHALIIWLRLEHTHTTYRYISSLFSFACRTSSRFDFVENLHRVTADVCPHKHSAKRAKLLHQLNVFSSKHQNCWDTEIEHNSVVRNPFWANKVANKLAYAKSVRTLMNFQGILMKMNSDTHDHIYIHICVCDEQAVLRRQRNQVAV